MISRESCWVADGFVWMVMVVEVPSVTGPSQRSSVGTIVSSKGITVVVEVPVSETVAGVVSWMGNVVPLRPPPKVML